MNQREIVNNERERLQGIFDPFNKKGSWKTVHSPASGPLVLGVYDSYIVTRVVPYMNRAGDVTKTVFWITMKSMGYHTGFQHVHTHKIVRIEQEDTFLLDLFGSAGDRYHIELIFPELQPEMWSQWERWKKYKENRAEYFKEVDRNVMEAHTRIAKAGRL